MRWLFEESPTKKEALLVKRLRGASKFFAFLWEIRAELFTEEFQRELEGAYVRHRKDVVPPAMLAMVWLLQAYTQASDRDAVENAAFDARWQLVLGTLGQDGVPFGQGSLSRFRARLVEKDLDKRLVDRTVELARDTGLFGWRNLKGALDSSPLRTAGRVEDTWNLIGRAMRTLVKAIATSAGVEASEIVEELGLTVVGDSSLKAMLDIDWDDRAARAQAFQRLVDEAERLSAWVESNKEKLESKPDVAEAIDDLKRVLEQDTEPDPDGSGTRIRRGVSKERMPSLGDRDARHGRKSKSKKFVGYKRHIAILHPSRLVADAQVLPANAPEHEAAIPLVDAMQSAAELSVVMFDRGYLAVPVIEELQTRGLPISCKPWVHRNGDRFPKSAFQLDLTNAIVTCPEGKQAAISTSEAGNRRVRFPAHDCNGCPQKARCTRSDHGRSVSVHPKEELLQQLAEAKNNPEGRNNLRDRVIVEHGLARIQIMQGSRARYKGTRKNTMDLRRYAALSNLMVIRSQRAA